MRTLPYYDKIVLWESVKKDGFWSGRRYCIL